MDSVQTRGQRAGDRAGVRDVLVRSFGRAVVADLAEALQQARAEHAGMTFVAERDGELVGYVQLSRSWLDARERLVEVLVLGPLGVVPEHQDRGIGGRLVNRAVMEPGSLIMERRMLKGIKERAERSLPADEPLPVEGTADPGHLPSR